MSTARGESLGLLEILSAEPDAFRPEDLALASLLAESCSATLERAARVEKLVFIDALTGIYNRSYYEIQVENEMARARREGSSMALCIADIDDFKWFNTNFGYDAGNRVITQVAQALRGAVRPFDTVARWGGEEFVVLLSAPVQSHDVATVSERLRTAVSREAMTVRGLDGEPHGMIVTVSIGVALFPDHQATAAALWNAANKALLEAKQPPKNQVKFFRPGSLRVEQPGLTPERRQGT